MKNVLAFVLAALSAYSSSFAIDLLVGKLVGIYSETIFPPVVSWAVTAAVVGFIALRLAPQRRFLVIPFAAITLLALSGGIVGRRYSLIVGAAMLAESAVVWLVTATQTENKHPDEPH